MRLGIRVLDTGFRLTVAVLLLAVLLAGCGGAGANGPAAPLAGGVGGAVEAGSGALGAGVESGGNPGAEGAASGAEGAAAPGADGAPSGADGTSAPAATPGEAIQGAGESPAPDSPGSGAPQEPESPSDSTPVRWYQKAPGYPLVTDDPAGQEMKVAMLTFDDGPHPGTTDRILDVLKEKKVKAIFFVTGYGARNEDLLRRIAAEGHVIGTHTMSHENLREKGKEEQRAEIVGVNEMVERVTGYQVRYFRPPFGAYNDDTMALMEELGLELINWSHGSRDWVGVQNGTKDPATVVRDVLAETPPDAQATRLHPGAIILMHDTHAHTADALPAIIDGLREKGYELVALEP